MKPSGKGWATLGFGVGIATSVGANVADTYVPPHDATANWHPQIGAVLSGMFWPIALLIAIEVLARVTWPDGVGWKLVRFGGVAMVAAIAATISYRHMSALLSYYQEDTWTATVGPASIDGLMLTCTAALLALGRGSQTAPEPRTASPEGNGVAPKPAAVLVAPSPLVQVNRARRQTGNGQRGKPGPQAEARAAWLASVADGKPLSGDELGKQFGYSSRWARLRIAEARQAQRG